MRYVLYFQPRSGSTLVCSRLNSGTGRLVNGFEIIDADAARRADLLTTGEFDNFDPAAKKVVVDRFFELHAGSDVAGFKVAPYQIDDDLAGFVQHVSHHVQRQIFLTRDNPVQSALSQLWSNARARQGLPPRILKGEEDTVARAHVDQAEFEYYVINSMLERESVLALSRLTDNPLVFSYETLCSDQSSVFDAIKTYLEVPGGIELVKSNQVKVRSDGAAGHVQNIEEVERWVQQMGLDSSLLHHELAQIGGGTGRLVVPPITAGSVEVQLKRRHDSRAFLATRIMTLRTIAISAARNRERQAQEAGAIIDDFKSRATKAEAFNIELTERIESLQSMQSAAQRNWERSAAQSLEHARQLEVRATRSEAFSQEETARLQALLNAAATRAESRDKEGAIALAAMQDRAERAEHFNEVVKEQLESARQGLEAKAHAFAAMQDRAERAEQFNEVLRNQLESARQALEAKATALEPMKDRAERAEQYNDVVRRERDSALQAHEVDRHAWDISRQQAVIHATELEARAVRAESYSAELMSAIERLRSEAAAAERDAAGKAAALKARADRADSYGADLRRLVDEANATIREKDRLIAQIQSDQTRST
jgi:hypothetical protein